MLIGNRRLTRSRLAVLAATAVVALGLLAGLSAFVLNPNRAAVGPLPAEALVLPGDARFVMGLDVQRFTASPFYSRFAQQPGMRPQALAELEQKTGLNPTRDLDQIVVAGAGLGRTGDTVALATGRFDVRKLGRSLEREGKVRAYTYEGATTYAFKADGQGATAIAFLGDGTLVFGRKERVEAAVSSHTRGTAPLRSNTTLLRLIEKVRPGSTFWIVGDQTLLSGLPGALPGPGGAAGSPMLNLPALRSLTLTGDLDPVVSLAITGEAADEPAAKNLADVVRGLVALMTIQAQQKPELQQLASAVTVATEANRVLLNARIPYELLDALQASVRPPVPAPAPASPGVPTTK